MKLFKVAHNRSNAIDDWTEHEYVVAESYSDVEENFPNAASITKVQSNIKIINKE